jgi:hypothetical protein
MFTSRHAPHLSLYGHLTFALKYEGVDLAVLKALFDVIDAKEIINIVKYEPTGIYSRRIWFLYEWLQGTKLKLPNAVKGNFTDALDTALQYGGPISVSKRHRVNNNFPGVPAFCLIIRKTQKLDQFIQLNLNKTVSKVLAMFIQMF